MTIDEARQLLCSGIDGIKQWNQRRAAAEQMPVLDNIVIEGANLSGADFHGMSLRGARMAGCELYEVNFAKADLREAKLNSVRAYDVDERGWPKFDGSGVRFANFSGAILDGAEMRGATLVYADLTGAFLSKVDLTDANMYGAILRGAKLSDAILNGAKLINADLSRRTESSNHEKTRFDDHAAFQRFFEKKRLDGTNLSGAKLIKANLNSAILEGAHCNFADFQEAELYSAVLTGATLYQADLRGAKFDRDSRLDHCDLTYADIRKAELQGATLAHASLANAELRGAILTNADFTDADLRGVGSRVPHTLPESFWSFLLWTFKQQLQSPYRLDRCRIRGVRQSPYVQEPWHVLDRNYTGFRMIANLMFLVLFFTPYILLTCYWVGLGRFQMSTLDFVVDRIERAAKALLQSEDPKAREWAKKANALRPSLERFRAQPESDHRHVIPEMDDAPWDALDDLQMFARELWETDRDVPQAEVLPALIGLLDDGAKLFTSTDSSARAWGVEAKALAIPLNRVEGKSWTKWRVWELLIGRNRQRWLFYFTLALIVYNVSRYAVTIRVASIREEADRSNVSPAWDDYKFCYLVLHSIVKVLFFVATISFAVHVIDWAMTPVFLASEA